MSSSTSLSALIRKIDDITVSTVDSTVALARSIHEAISGVQKASAEVVLDPSVRSTVKQHIKRTLNNNHYCSGAGFASHIESTATTKEYWLLEWWYKKDNGLSQAHLDLDQATQQRLDFRTFEWFKHSPPAGKAYIHGPYVDYICNISYTLTSAVPVYYNDQFLGVAGVDLLVSQIEAELLSCAHHDYVILTNLENRIIFSSWPRFRVGELLSPANS
ncbi:cache domain-containing protein, partial [Citrobacter arsenatis]|uniref:cache domain-containing protein n=1 Tax=Citrobacter arsenatis TaxID=2546350 RepID=UPI003D7F36C2